MAVSFDVSSNSGSQVSVSSFSWNHTVASDANLLIVFVHITSNQTISSVTYNSVAMERLGYIANGTNVSIGLFGLVNPSTGTNSVAVTLGGAITCLGGAMSFKEVNILNPYFQINTKTSSTDPDTISISAPKDGLVAGGIMVAHSSMTSDAGQTEQYNVAVSTSSAVAGYELTTALALYTLSWSGGSILASAMAAVALNPITSKIIPLNKLRPAIFTPGVAK